MRAGRITVACGLVMAVSLWASQAAAQRYRFPSRQEQVDLFYPTAYYDHGDVDWNCGTDTYAGHRGNDFGGGSWSGMDAGRDIVAAADGVVTAVVDGEFDRCTSADCPGGGGFGNYVKIEHPNGMVTYYGHLKQWSIVVRPWEPVVCGQLLAQMGSSGLSTGPHLHFDLRNTAGDRIDAFAGSCSTSPGYWVEQGAYQGLPALACDTSFPSGCSPAARVACGARLAAGTHAAKVTQQTNHYGCESLVYSGPERSWIFSSDRDETVTISLTGLAADLDLYLVDSLACDGTGCLASSTNAGTSNETLVFDAQAGKDYLVVVDGWQGAASDAQLFVDCTGSEPPCEPDEILTCGQTVVTRNDLPPASDRLPTSYGCGHDEAYDGPERLWSFTSDVLQRVTVQLTSQTADLDLLLLSAPPCAAGTCLAASTRPGLGEEQLSFDAAPGESFVLVVDGWQGASGEFALNVTCQETPEPAPLEEVPPTDTAETEGGCDCAGTPNGAQLFWLIPLGWLVRRRQRQRPVREKSTS